jgi:hypothetical protein
MSPRPSSHRASAVSEAVAIELTDPAGEPLRIDWTTEALAALDPAAPGETPVWRLGGELDWDEVEALRIFSGRLEDGRLVAIAAVRPLDAGGHGEEVVAGLLGDSTGFDPLAEALLSTEYQGDGLPSRVGLELYGESGELPVRIAGDVRATADGEQGGVRRTSAALALRASGSAGAGILDVLTRA